MDIIGKVRQTMARYAMVAPGEKVVVGVSGGPDSTALLCILDRLARDGNFSLVVAHVNHGLRPTAAAEETFVIDLACRLGWPFSVSRAQVALYRRQRKCSLEEAGRELRYRFYHEVLQRHTAHKIAVGHHRGDLAETVLLNLVRGSGIDGLKGMLPVREGFIIRPLLFCTRKEIVAFLKEANIPFMVDESNKSPTHLRNRIRHELMPLLEERFNPRVEVSLARLAAIAAREDDFLKETAAAALASLTVAGDGTGVVLALPALRALHPALQYRVIRAVLAGFSSEGRAAASGHVQAVLELVWGNRPNGILMLPDGVVVRRCYEQLRFHSGADGSNLLKNAAVADYAYPVSPPVELCIREAGLTLRLTLREGQGGQKATDFHGNVALLDWDRIVRPLTVRNVRPGDRIQPLGMKGTKKIKDLFIDAKIPQDQRRRIPLLVDGLSVIWVGGMRIDERVRVHSGTARILKVEII